jgi:hypothetical protein
VSLACGGTDGNETYATVESLQTLEQPKAVAESAPAVRASIIGAASRLCDLQADVHGDNSRNGFVDDDPDDGGWDWQMASSATSHSSSPSPTNLYGATGLGLWTALQFGSRLRVRTALMETYWGIEQNPEIASAPDVVLLTLMSGRHSDGRYADLARERYDKRIEAAGDASLLAAKIRDDRHAAGADGLIAYDLAWFALAARELGQRFPGSGYHADFTRFVATVLDDLNSSAPDFDYRDAHEGYYVTGLAWSMLVCSWSPRSRASFDDLRSRLLNQQLSSGAWPHNADYLQANLQATAHALIAFGLTGPREPAQVVNSAVSWIASQQNDNRGWSYGPEQEYPLLDAEAALGMYLVHARPTELATKGVSKLAFTLSEPRPMLPPAPAAPFRYTLNELSP